jgi:hypothetical protein
MSSFEVELCALVFVWRSKGADMESMVEALDAESASIRHHIAAERRSAPSPADDVKGTR